MFLRDNPVLQWELLVNLRRTRAFVLLFFYQAALATVVYFAWPQESRLVANAEAARRLVDMFFLGQYLLASLMAPSFAAATITGEKERKTYEMLLASPLRPGAIVLGKLTSSLTHLAILIVTSLPIVLLCLPLGGVSLYEVLAAYLGLGVSVVVFGMISVACSSYFRRTASSLVASYLLILPLALLGVLLWASMAGQGQARLLMTTIGMPLAGLLVVVPLFRATSLRLLHPPDVGSEGNEVVDLEAESKEVVGLVIDRHQWPDRLFAPHKRDDLLPDGANPVYDKELHSEIFAQGTLMLRLVIQVSMFLAVPIMAFCLFIKPQYASWYIRYVLLFNVLVGPVFSAGSITSERERQTLDLLLTTTISPWKILWAKLIVGLRVSSVLTLFLFWPVILAAVLFLIPQHSWTNLFSVLAYLLIILVTCVTTAMTALLSSVVFRKTSVSLMTAYLVLVIGFATPEAMGFFAETFFPKDQATLDRIHELRPAEVNPERIAVALNQANDSRQGNAQGSRGVTASDVAIQLRRDRAHRAIRFLAMGSPFAAAREVPMEIVDGSGTGNDSVRPSGQSGSLPNQPEGDAWFVAMYLFVGILGNSAILAFMIRLFHRRWRVAQ